MCGADKWGSVLFLLLTKAILHSIFIPWRQHFWQGYLCPFHIEPHTYNYLFVRPDVLLLTASATGKNFSNWRGQKWADVLHFSCPLLTRGELVSVVREDLHWKSQRCFHFCQYKSGRKWTFSLQLLLGWKELHVRAPRKVLTCQHNVIKHTGVISIPVASELATWC